MSAVAGFKIATPIDGLNVWQSLSDNTPSPRNEALINYDSAVPYTSFVSGSWKYVSGSPNTNDTYDTVLTAPEKEVGPGARTYTTTLTKSDAAIAIASIKTLPKLVAKTIKDIRDQSKLSCKANISVDKAFLCTAKAACLFNIEDDPCERYNLAAFFPTVLKQLEDRIQSFKTSAVPARNKSSDSKSNPLSFNGTWKWWTEEKPTKA